MIAFCGIDCSKCKALVATEKNDDALRAQVAAEWAKAYNAPITADQINCTGCKSEGVKFVYCENMCEIRKCSNGRKLETCADCADFACERLTGFFKMAPEAQKELEGLRQKKGSKKAGSKRPKKTGR